MNEHKDKKEEKKTDDLPMQEDLMARLAECERIRDEYLSGWQRAKADFANYKKEEYARLEELAKYGVADLLRDLLTVLDNFDLAIASLEKNGVAEKGIYLIRSQLEDFLRKRGVMRIDLKPGDPFNPSVAEAVAEVESESPPGVIVDEIEAGYRLHEKILRPARVRVSKSNVEIESLGH